MHKIIFYQLSSCSSLGGWERLGRCLPHISKKVEGKEKPKDIKNKQTNKNRNFQTTRRNWIEGLLHITMFSHSKSIYIGNPKLFLVGLDFFGCSEHSLQAYCSFQFLGRTPTSSEIRQLTSSKQKKSFTEFLGKRKRQTTKLLASVQRSYMAGDIKCTNSITQLQ